jgi:GNAT superfamily N-acetyltransferase
MRQMLRAYPPGTDAMVDQMRAAGPLARFLTLRILGPLYFAREQGWVIRGERGVMAAMMYLRREAKHGIRVLHIDDINVDAAYRGRGYAQRLMNLAEELARAEGRASLKLAVTVANTPAVTLYRRLGYHEQHHRYFTFTSPSPAPSSAPSSPDVTPDVTLRPLWRWAAAEANRRFYHLEQQASVPELADMLAAYYTPRVRGAGMNGCAVERGGERIGYVQAFRRGGRWNLRLALRPDLWGGEVERQAIQLASGAIGETHGAPIALDVPSAAHFEALRAGPNALAGTLGLVERTYERMLMVKPLASE